MQSNSCIFKILKTQWVCLKLASILAAFVLNINIHSPDSESDENSVGSLISLSETDSENKMFLCNYKKYIEPQGNTKQQFKIVF